MVEQNAVAGKDIVGFPVINGDPVGIYTLSGFTC